MNLTLCKALDALNDLISRGIEYPDAHCAVVTNHGLSDQEAADLAQAYDNQDARGAA